MKETVKAIYLGDCCGPTLGNGMLFLKFCLIFTGAIGIHRFEDLFHMVF